MVHSSALMGIEMGGTIMAFGHKGESDRFKVTGGFAVNTACITDTKTGVQYLVVFTGAGVAVTPLLDKDGKVTLAEK